MEHPARVFAKAGQVIVSMRPFGSPESIIKKLKPSEIDRLVLLRNSSVTAEAVRLLRDTEVVMCAKLSPVATIIPVGKVPSDFNTHIAQLRLSKAKKKKLAYVFAKAACRGKIKVLMSVNHPALKCGAFHRRTD